MELKYGSFHIVKVRLSLRQVEKAVSKLDLEIKVRNSSYIGLKQQQRHQTRRYVTLCT